MNCGGYAAEAIQASPDQAVLVLFLTQRVTRRHDHLDHVFAMRRILAAMRSSGVRIGDAQRCNWRSDLLQASYGGGCPVEVCMRS